MNSIDPTAAILLGDPYDFERENKDDNSYSITDSQTTFDTQLQQLHFDTIRQAPTTCDRAPNGMASNVKKALAIAQSPLPTVSLPVNPGDLCSRQSRVHVGSSTEAPDPFWPHSSVNLDTLSISSREALLQAWPQNQQYGRPQDSPRVSLDSQDNGTAEKPGPSDTAEVAGKASVRERSRCNSHRSDQDHFLVRSKLSGMSYKEIKAQGHFKEAESTLRGRFRTLTKSRERRLRKPHWHDRDIEMLRRAVAEYSGRGKDVTSLTPPVSQKDGLEGPKIPWKHVAEYVARHGTYHFGNATCRKKWNEICGSDP
ncbi:MAG: hypothetical protein Q9187_002932 [Circinaria calcarea]